MKFLLMPQFDMGQVAVLSGVLQPVTQGSLLLLFYGPAPGDPGFLFLFLISPDKPRSGAHHFHDTMLARNPLAWPPKEVGNAAMPCAWEKMKML